MSAVAAPLALAPAPFPAAAVRAFDRAVAEAEREPALDRAASRRLALRIARLEAREAALDVGRLGEPPCSPGKQGSEQR